MHDLIVIGAGPAGRALAAASHLAGLNVLCIAPEPDAPWVNNYGAWIDQLPASLRDTVGHRWTQSDIWLDAEHPVHLDRAYGNLDGRALQKTLVAPTFAGVVERIDGETVHLDDGQRLLARIVIDAAGASTRFGARRGAHAPGFQRAYGLDLQVERHDFPLDTMRLMDFTAVPGADAWASFVYVMPHGPERIFVEETSLVGRPPIGLDLLEARLRARLAYWGLEVRGETGVERCHIPMGGALPDFKHPVLTYGAAAGMTHPATGYQLTHALRCAGPAAQALAENISDPTAARRAFWDAVWPREKQRLWQLYRFGMEVLLRMDQDAQRAFFAGFFELPAAQQVAWLAGTLTIKEASSVMWTVFKHIPGGLRARLIGHGMRPHGWRMLGALMG